MSTNDDADANIDLEAVLARVVTASGATNDAEIANALKVGRSSVPTWRTRKTVPLDVLVGFANAKGLNLYWLLYGRAPVQERDLNLEGWGVVFEDPRLQRLRDYSFVPFYDIALSAGRGAEVLEEQPKAYNAWRREYLLRRGLDEEQLAEFSIKGTSMVPELNPGDTVLVDLRDKSVEVEDIYVLRVENSLVVKYVRRDGEHELVLRSANADEYPERRLNVAAYPEGEVTVIGRVVRQGRDR